MVIDFNLPPNVPRTTSVQSLAPAKGKGDAYTDRNYNYAALYTFFIFPVPFTVEIDTQLNFESTMSASTTGHIQGPGIWFEESYTMGYAYYPSSNSWGPINERKSILNTRSPSIDIKGNAYYKGTPIFVLSFLMFAAWRIDFQLRPWLVQVFITMVHHAIILQPTPSKALTDQQQPPPPPRLILAQALC